MEYPYETFYQQGGLWEDKETLPPISLDYERGNEVCKNGHFKLSPSADEHVLDVASVMKLPLLD